MKHYALTRPELLIMIAAVGLVGILKVGPWMAAQRNAASFQRERQCQDNLKMIGLALLQYQQDYDGHFPLASKGTVSGWSSALKPYGVGWMVISTDGSRRTNTECPEGKANTATSTDYFFNARLQGLATKQLPAPATVIAFGDGTDNAPLNATLSALPSVWIKNPSSPASRHVLNNIRYANYAFADGHVKSIEPKRIGSTVTGDTKYQTFAIR